MNLREKPFFLDDAAIRWVNEKLEKLTTAEKVGQLFCVNYKFGTEDEVEYFYGITQPGGCMYRAMPLARTIEFTNTLQTKTEIPLLIAANLEKGGNGIVQEGTLIGAPLAVAATGDVSMAEKLATVCAREGKAAGANWAFAPIIDIDTNFRNPITNTRTFGSNPNTVLEMGRTYVETIQKLGLAASIKHFPGDGQDERDQHLVTSINDLSCEDWDETYGHVYKECIESGALSCMIGHIMLPAYSRRLSPGIRDEDILPASLSPELLNGLLRNRLGFQGLIVTDATTMAGFTTAMSRKDAVPRSIAAGCDMFLFARNFEEDYRFMLDGVHNGILSPERLDEAVTRILALKAALGLHVAHNAPQFDAAQSIVGCAEHRMWAKLCAEKAITLVKEQNGVLPITKEKYSRILFYPIEASGGVSQYAVKEGACARVKELLQAEGFSVDEFTPQNDSEGRTPPTSAVTQNYDLVLYVANLATRSNQTAVRIEWAQPMGANCPHYIHDVQTVFVSLENPYHLLDVPRIKTFINTYGATDETLEALVNKLTGRSCFTGQSPVDAFCGKWDAKL